MSNLRVSNLTKVFPGGVRAVDGFTLAVPDGQTAVILGPSGCGKTTLLRLVAGLESATSGTVEVGGKVVNSLAPKDRDVAMVFQNHPLYPHLNVRRNLAFGLKMRKAPRREIDDRVRWVSGLLGIDTLLARMPAQLSGGQRQRVALGRAIVRRPQIFLFDEPLSQLDAGLRRQMRVELRQLLQQLSTTTLYVTHDVEEARELADLVCTMDHGKVLHTGTVDDTFRAGIP
jgi:sn-glycerol 3-phosphate transport system ATP-binding protein